MKTVGIPATIAVAKRKLAQLGELATATEWHRAAIVAAFTEKRAGQGTSVRTDGSRLSYTEFSELGIVGLRSHNTVEFYAEVWMDHHDGERPAPGQTVEIPPIEWPPQDRNKGSRTTASNIGDVIAHNPAIAAAACFAIAGMLEELPPEPVNELVKAVIRLRSGGGVEPGSALERSLDELWAIWLTDADSLFIRGARLTDRTEKENVVLGPYSAAALAMYHRLTERRIDAEFRQLIEDQMEAG